MSVEQNDTKILALKKVIEEKREKINKMATTFAPKTNCLYKGVNLHVAKRADLLKMLREVLTLQKLDDEIKEMDYGFNDDEFLIENYTADDWLHDIKSRMDVLSIRNEKDKLAKMEKRLEQLLSNEKKVELEIEAMMNDLK